MIDFYSQGCAAVLDALGVKVAVFGQALNYSDLLQERFPHIRGRSIAEARQNATRRLATRAPQLHARMQSALDAFEQAQGPRFQNRKRRITFDPEGSSSVGWESAGGMDRYRRVLDLNSLHPEVAAHEGGHAQLHQSIEKAREIGMGDVLSPARLREEARATTQGTRAAGLPVAPSLSAAFGSYAEHQPKVRSALQAAHAMFRDTFDRTPGGKYLVNTGFKFEEGARKARRLSRMARRAGDTEKYEMYRKMYDRFNHQAQQRHSPDQAVTLGNPYANPAIAKYMRSKDQAVLDRFHQRIAPVMERYLPGSAEPAKRYMELLQHVPHTVAHERRMSDALASPQGMRKVLPTIMNRSMRDIKRNPFGD